MPRLRDVFSWRRYQQNRKLDQQAEQLYQTIAAHARMPVFYLGGGIADTLAGRFDLLTLHVFLLAEALRRQDDVGEGAGTDMAARLVDTMFSFMDAGLRELGTGDLAVPKRVRRLAEIYYDRYQALQAVFTSEAADSGDRTAALEACLKRSLLAPGEERQDGAVEMLNAAGLARYMQACHGELVPLSLDDIIAQGWRWPLPDDYLQAAKPSAL